MNSYSSNFFKKKSVHSYIAILSTFLFALVGSIVALVRYWQYEVFYFDFGIFDQAIWEVAHFNIPLIEHFIPGIQGKIIFADHFNPSIFFLSPVYWFTDRSEVLLIAQAVIAALSGYILYRISLEVIKNSVVSLSIMLCYFLFVGLQNAVITEFHELTIMTLPLTLLWWSVIKKKVWTYFLLLVITLGFKESLFSLGIGIGIAIFILYKNWRKIALMTIFISLMWGIVTIKLLIPYFSGGNYLYTPNLPDTISGMLLSLINEEEKRRTLFFSFASFGFLPLFSPAFYPTMLQDYALRFMPEGFWTRWGLGMHYNAQSAVILALSSIYGANFILRYKIIKQYLLHLTIFLVFFALFLNLKILRGPYNLIYNTAFYNHTKNFSYLNQLIARVPKKSTVMTQNVLASRFTHQKVWLLSMNYKKFRPEYILIDFRQGQNPNNFFGTPNAYEIYLALLNDPTYAIYYQQGEQVIFKSK